MNVIRSRVCCPQLPAAKGADFAESIEYRHTAILVKKIGHLVHLLSHRLHAPWVRFR